MAGLASKGSVIAVDIDLNEKMEMVLVSTFLGQARFGDEMKGKNWNNCANKTVFQWLRSL